MVQGSHTRGETAVAVGTGQQSAFDPREAAFLRVAEEGGVFRVPVRVPVQPVPAVQTGTKEEGLENDGAPEQRGPNASEHGLGTSAVVEAAAGHTADAVEFADTGTGTAGAGAAGVLEAGAAEGSIVVALVAAGTAGDILAGEAAAAADTEDTGADRKVAEVEH